MPSRNPPWSRDELILALNLYMKHRKSLPSKVSPEVAKLSGLLNALGRQFDQQKEDFRNINGVYMKLMNFRRLDPEYTLTGGVGLQRGGHEEEFVWDDFAGSPGKLELAANAIGSNIEAFGQPDAKEDFGDVTDGIIDAEEGRLLTRLHIRRERSKALVAKKKELTLKNIGKLACEACGFDFAAVYGERGKGFAEVHHTRPIITLTPGSKTSITDLAILCANCHRMIHARRPWLSVDELRALVLQVN